MEIPDGMHKFADKLFVVRCLNSFCHEPHWAWLMGLDILSRVTDMPLQVLVPKGDGINMVALETHAAPL